MLSSVFLLAHKAVVAPSCGPARMWASRAGPVPATVTVILMLLLQLVAVLPLLLGRPAPVGTLVLLLGVKGVVELVVIAPVGAGVCLLLPGVQLQRAVPHAVTAVDQQT